MNSYNETLRIAREKKGYSYQDMANRLGISKPYYWQIENGKRNLYYVLAIKIAKIFGVRPDKLFYNYYQNKSEK